MCCRFGISHHSTHAKANDPAGAIHPSAAVNVLPKDCDDCKSEETISLLSRLKHTELRPNKDIDDKCVKKSDDEECYQIKFELNLLAEFATFRCPAFR